MAREKYFPETEEKIISQFGEELGKITARLKKAGISRRDMRYYLAFAELSQSGQLSTLLETIPTNPERSAHLIYNPLTRKISWITNKELNYPLKTTPLQRKIQGSNYDILISDGELLFHFTPTGEFEIWPFHLWKEKLEPPYF